MQISNVLACTDGYRSTREQRPPLLGRGTKIKQISYF
jgi:hypothetical protein